MTIRSDVSQLLRSLERDEGDTLRAYRRVAEQLANPVVGFLLTLLARDREQDRAMLRRISAGALDVLQQTSLPAVGGCCDAEGIDTLARAAARRAQELQSLA